MARNKWHPRVQNLNLFSILDSIQKAISIKNLEGQYIGYNKLFLQWISINQKNAIGRTDYDFFEKDIADFYRKIDRSVIESGQPIHINEWINSSDGRQVWTDITTSPLRDSRGGIIGVTCVCNDDCDQRDVDQNLKNDIVSEKNRNLTASTDDDISSADSIKKEFIAKISHEIRTPLNGIVVMSNLMLTNPLTEKQRRYANIIKSSADSLLALVNDILEFSKIEAGKLEIEKIHFSIDDVICKTLDSFWDSAAEKNIQIDTSIDPSLPEWVIADPLRLSQILNNLMSNAIKFTHDGGNIHLSVNLPYRSSQTVIINFTILDSGIGISEKQISTIFTAFGQADISTSRKYGGTGLGLVICKQLCDQMGGRIRVKSTLGKGSEFSFLLPFELPSKIPEQQYCEFAWTGKKILVVDDNPTTRYTLSKLLAVKSSLVQCIGSGEEALNLLRKNEAPLFDLLLFDLHMPGIDGIETVKRIQIEKLTDCAVIMLMVNSRDRIEIADSAKNAGIRGFITKPIRPATLFKEIQPLSPLYLSSHHVQNNGFPNEIYSGISVLTVEDHEINREVITELLKTVAGIDTDLACNGAEAVEKVQLYDYDIVFMDIQMPVMDGLQATRAIRNLNKAGVDKLPIIAMTAHALKDELKRFISAGLNGHITKPILIEDLLSTLSLCIPGKRCQDNITSKETLTDISKPNFEAIPIEIPELDMAQGLRLLCENRTIYFNLLQKFVKDESFKIVTSSMRDEPEQTLRKIHSIRSIAANLGGNSLASAASRLEKAILDNIEHDDLLQEFILRNNTLRSNIISYFKDQKEESLTEQIKPAGNDDLLNHLLSELKKHVAYSEPKACKEIMNFLMEKHWPSNIQTNISELFELIDRYRFDDATVTLNRLIDTLHINN